MKSLKQWITWRPVPVTGKSKIMKVPYDPITRRDVDPHNSKYWMNYTTAKSHDHNVGFVLTDDDPYFCIDLDHSYVNGKWTQCSINTCSWFPGIYIEVSYSGDGLHLFGRITPPIVPHRSRVNSPNADIELYYSNRFIAFSETSAVGDCNIDFTAPLTQFISLVLPPDFIDRDSDKLYGGFLTPDIEWLGPEDDDELISRMLKSKPSATSLLNGKATLQNLWKENVDVLIRSYPSGTDIYDRSAADLALFSHLAFWTGKDGPRMERIARQSGLMRPKWDKHKKYLTDPLYTIHNACARCNTVYRDPKAVKEQDIVDSGNDNYITGSQLFDITAQVDHFKSCVYILDQHRIFTPNAGVLKPEQFDTWYGGATFALTHDWKKSTKSASEAFRMSQGYRFPKVHTACFRPELKPGQVVVVNGHETVNTFIPPKIQIGTGKVDQFLFLMVKLFPDPLDYEIMINYMASLVQYPGKKFRWCVVMQGTEGNGKSLIMDIITQAVGERYSHVPQTNDISNKFNSWMQDKLFIAVEEIRTVDKRELIDALKPLITNPRIPIQPKGGGTIMVDNRANFMMATNYKDAIAKTKNDRRYAVFFCPQQSPDDLIRDGLTEEWFVVFTTWLNASGYADVAGYLKRYQIKPGRNPVTKCVRAPRTSVTDLAVNISLGGVEQEIADAIEQGLYGFKGGWISSWALTQLLEGKRLTKSAAPNKRAALLAELGYIKNPWTTGGRASGALVNENNTRPVLYVRKSMRFDPPGVKGATTDYQNSQVK